MTKLTAFALIITGFYLLKLYARKQKRKRDADIFKIN